MSQRMIGFLILLISVGCLVAFLFYFNPHLVTVHFGPGDAKTWEAPLALVLLLVFFFGALSTGILAVFLGLQHTFMMWRHARKEQRERAHLEQMIRGREQLASKHFSLAKMTFQKIIDRDPENIIVRILLAETLKLQENLKGALIVLDEARASQKQNLELLILTAEIYEQLGNFTAAYDNLYLVLQGHDCLYALQKIVDYSIKLERYDCAIEFQKRVIKILPVADQSRSQELLASLELEVAKNMYVENRASLRKAVEEILKRHRDFPSALSVLAMIDRENKKYDGAAKLLIKAFSLSGDLQCLHDLVEMWLEQEQPSKALSTVKSALGELSDDLQSKAQEGSLFLVTLYMRLAMVDEASKELEALFARGLLSGGLDFAVLKAKLLQCQGRDEEALSILMQAVEKTQSVFGSTLLRIDPLKLQSKKIRQIGFEGTHKLGMPPAPRFSTS